MAHDQDAEGGDLDSNEDDEMEAEASIQFQQAIRRLSTLTKLYLHNVSPSEELFGSPENSWTHLRWVHLLWLLCWQSNLSPKEIHDDVPVSECLYRQWPGFSASFESSDQENFSLRPMHVCKVVASNPCGLVIRLSYSA